MKKLLACILLSSMVSCTVIAKNATSMHLIQTIPLPEVHGRIDHMAVDIKGGRLFIAARGNNSLEIVDLRAGKRMHSITGLNEPQGVLFLSKFNKLYVTGGGDGICRIFDGSSLRLEKNIRFSADADNIRYNPVTKQVYIGCCDGAIKVIDSTTGTVAGETTLKAHPEAFDIDVYTGRIFVNLPDTASIVVIDSLKREIIETWPVRVARENFSMALPGQSHPLYIGSRNPPKLLVFNSSSGTLLAQVLIDGDADDIYYNSRDMRLYISCGDGFIDIIQKTGDSGYALLEKIPTKPGARTSLFVPEMNRYFLAVPARHRRPAEIAVFATAR
jgi:WD40 repeat protein